MQAKGSNIKAVKKDVRLVQDELISKRQEALVQFQGVLQKLRSKAETAPTLEEITEEVEAVRAQSYVNKTFLIKMS